MKQNIDTYFKEKLSNRQFELKDAYWKEAEAMLMAAEKKKRRGMLFWWFGGLAPLVAVSLFFIFGYENTTSDAVLKEQPQLIESEPVEVMPAIKNQVIEDMKNTPSVADSKVERPVAENRHAGEVVTKLSAPAPRAVLTDFSVLPKIETAEKGMQLEETPSPSSAEKPKKIEKKSILKRLAVPKVLSNISLFVDGNFDKEFPTKNTCYKPSPFHFGVSAAQLMQVAPKSGENLITAFYGGIVFQYDLNKRWFVSSGLGYQRRAGHYEASKITEMRNYRFGLELMENLLRPTSLHYLEMPFLVGWKKGHHLLEGGILVDYLTGVRGEIGKLEKVDNERMTKEFIAHEKGWISEDGFTRWNVSPSVGYRYRVNKELSFGLSAQYNLRPLTNKEPIFGDYILQEDDRFNVRLQAVYLLK